MSDKILANAESNLSIVVVNEIALLCQCGITAKQEEKHKLISIVIGSILVNVILAIFALCIFFSPSNVYFT